MKLIKLQDSRLLTVRATVRSGEGNGTPLQDSCLENPMDGGAWGATVHGVTELAMTERLSHHHNRYLNYVSV